ncbi:MAG: hypothetical protein OXG33_01170 [Chloroflexi bacterium]|nr:hypothetical protein [Chloroflexota bacterium]
MTLGTSRRRIAKHLSRRTLLRGASSAVAARVLAASGAVFVGQHLHEPSIAAAAEAETAAVRLLVLGRDESPWPERVAAVAARRPDIDLQVSHASPSPSGLAEVIAGARRGGAFDLVAGLPGTQLARLARQGLVLALNAWLGGLDLVPAMERLGRHHQARIGLPLSGYPVYALVNPQALERAGVAEPGATYREWLDAARRLTDRERLAYGWGVVADVPEIETVAMSSGGRFWTGAHVAPSDGWQWYADLIHREAVSPPPYAWDGLLNAHTALGAGEVAMTLRSAWVLDELPNGGPWHLVPLPAWDQKRRATPVAADYVAVAADAQDIQAAVDVASLLATEAWPAPGARGLPAWRPALETFAETKGLPLETLTEAAAHWRRPSLEMPGAEIAQARLLPAIDDVMSSGQPVEARMAALAEELQDLRQSAAG